MVKMLTYPSMYFVYLQYNKENNGNKTTIVQYNHAILNTNYLRLINTCI